MESITPALLSWLTYTGFLTKRLQHVTGNARLAVHAEQWDIATAWDQSELNIYTPRLCREIIMYSFDNPCWYARTIIPQSTYNAHTTLFNRLQHESLGQLIFHGTEITRSNLRYYAITPNSIEYQWLHSDWHQQCETLWVRIANFQVLSNEQFYLIEIFLPFFMQTVIFAV